MSVFNKQVDIQKQYIFCIMLGQLYNTVSGCFVFYMLRVDNFEWESFGDKLMKLNDFIRHLIPYYGDTSLPEADCISKVLLRFQYDAVLNVLYHADCLQ